MAKSKSAQSLEALHLSNEEAKKITRESLLGALLRIVKKKPFDKISVSELVLQAGVSRTAFYRHYTSVEDIIKIPVVEILDALTRSLGDEKYREEPLLWYNDLFSYLEGYKEVLETLMLITNGDFMTIKVLDDIFVGKSEDERAEYELEAFKGALRSIISKWICDGFVAPTALISELCYRTQLELDVQFKI